jgi:hypothetical protein
MGYYSMYAPSCNGCDFGKKERLMYGRLAHVSMSVFNAQQKPEPEEIRIAWDAMKVCLGGTRDEVQQLIFFASALEKLDSSHQEVVDLIKAEKYEDALKILQS